MDDERIKWFKLTEKKVTHHIDTLYYSLSLIDDKCDSVAVGIKSLITVLDDLKQEKMNFPLAEIEYCGLDVMPTSFSIYQYHLQCKECYDIFLAKNIPNELTPRVVVQIRSRMLVTEGVSKALDETYSKVEEILMNFNLGIDVVRENRIDYAYHTNIIQNSNAFFNDEYVARHMRKTLGKITDVKNIKDGIMQYETMSVGQRKSNNVFVRMYNKTREVIEKKYKSFFFEKWRQDGLISEYDFYCLNKAFEKGSFETGLLIGRIEWYLEYGKNEELKSELRELRIKCEIRSDNSRFIERQLAGVLPNVTMVTNIEFQTKREFYMSFEKSIKEFIFNYDRIPELERIYKILYLRREFLDYLTTKVICFIERDEKNKRKYKMCDWWKRIHRCKVKSETPKMFELYRTHDRVADLDRAKMDYYRATARYSMILQNDLGYRSFIEDCADTLCSLNDNDFYGFSANPETGEIVDWDINEYNQVQRKLVRQHRSIIKDIGEHKMIRVKVLKATFVTASKDGKKLDNPYCEALFQFDTNTAETFYINTKKYERPQEIRPGMQFDIMLNRAETDISYMQLVQQQQTK